MVRLSYNWEGEAKDNTADASYRRFYLKNLAPIFRKDYAHIPLRFFPAFFFKSRLDPFSAWNEFLKSRSWVRVNRYRFQRDAHILTGLWEHPGDIPPSEPIENHNGSNGSVQNPLPFKEYKGPDSHSEASGAPGSPPSKAADSPEEGESVPLNFRLPGGASKT
jgi:hypothetical protein